jgi:predicted dehydrogenase
MEFKIRQFTPGRFFLMKLKKLRAAIIGLGHQAAEDHIPGIYDSQFASLKAICDTNPKKLQEWEKKLRVKGYKDFHELLDKEDIDFIVIATPHDTHMDIIKKASTKGIHVLKEKPFARSLKEALFINKICRESGIKVMVTLQRRFNPIYTSFFQLKDLIGEPFFVDAKYTLFVDSPYKGWRGSREKAGGGCIIDMGYHMIDMIIWYFGLPKNVHAEFSCKAIPWKKYDAEDTAHILFAYENGLHGSLILSRYYPPKTEFIKIVGSRGIIEIERGKIRRLKSNGEVSEVLIREHSWPAAAANQIDFFCKVINGEEKEICDPQYHLQHMAFIEACYLSKIKEKYINPRELLEKYINQEHY